MGTMVIKMNELADAIGANTKKQVDQIRMATISGCYRSIPMLVKDSPVDTGLYAQSWDVVVEKLSVAIGNSAPHAPIIEYGARPFTPPIKPLLEWAKRVLQDPSQPPDYSSEVWALAKGTQKKISRLGIKPRFVMQRNIPKIIQNIKQEFERIA